MRIPPFRIVAFVQLSVMVAYSLRVVASIARYGQWVLANAACIIGVAFRNTMLLTQVLGYIAISLLYRNLQLFKQAFHKCLTHNPHKSCIFERLATLFCRLSVTFSSVVELYDKLCKA